MSHPCSKCGGSTSWPGSCPKCFSTPHHEPEKRPCVCPCAPCICGGTPVDLPNGIRPARSEPSAAAMDFALASNTVQEIVDILDSATSDDWDAPHGQGPDDRMRLVLARALDAFAESERKSTLHEVWYALKASLPAGPVQEIMNKVIDEISERKSSKPGGW